MENDNETFPSIELIKYIIESEYLPKENDYIPHFANYIQKTFARVFYSLSRRKKDRFSLSKDGKFTKEVKDRILENIPLNNNVNIILHKLYKEVFQRILEDGYSTEKIEIKIEGNKMIASVGKKFKPRSIRDE